MTESIIWGVGTDTEIYQKWIFITFHCWIDELISGNEKQWVLPQHQNDNDVVKDNESNQALMKILSSIKDSHL